MYSGIRLFKTAFMNTRRQICVSGILLVAITCVLTVILYLAESRVDPNFSFWDAFIWPYEKYLGDPGKVVDDPLISPIGKFIALNKKTQYRVVPRRVPVISLQAKKGMSEKDIIDTVSKFKEFRLRNLAASQVASEHPQDRLVIEMLPLDEQTVDGYIIEHTDYGIKINRHSNITIITPSAATENSIGHIGYYLAQFGGFNYVSREFVTDVDEPVSYYKIEGERKEWEKPLQKFVDDIRQLSEDSQHWNIILVSSDNVYETQFHFVHRAKEETGLSHTTLDEDWFLELYAAFSEKMKAEYEYLSDMDQEYKPVGNKNIGVITGGGTKNNAITLRISYSVTTWSSSSAPIIVDMAKVIKQYVEKPERSTFEDEPSWKDVGCGYGTNKN